MLQSILRTKNKFKRILFYTGFIVFTFPALSKASPLFRIFEDMFKESRIDSIDELKKFISKPGLKCSAISSVLENDTIVSYPDTLWHSDHFPKLRYFPINVGTNDQNWREIVAFDFHNIILGGNTRFDNKLRRVVTELTVDSDGMIAESKIQFAFNYVHTLMVYSEITAVSPRLYVKQFHLCSHPKTE